MTSFFRRNLVLFFVGFLPWSVVFSVFSSERLGLDFLRFSKEILLAVISVFALWDIWRKRIFLNFDRLDIAIILYIVTLLSVSLIQNTPLVGIVYGLRYDTVFLVAFMMLRRILPQWGIRFQDIAHTFLLSGGIMLFLSILIRYVFGETILTLVGFSDLVSVWGGSGPPPIYHGIPGASVVRFQGMLEGPNQMAFFLLVFIGTFLAENFRYKKYRFINSVIVLGLFFLLLQTYSRSALLAVFVSTVCVSMYQFIIIFSNKPSRSRFKGISWKKILAVLGMCVLAGGTLFFQFGPKFTELITRRGSTSGHFERMYIGFLRFKEAPFGHGLAQAGPASRSIADVTQEPIPTNSLDPEMLHLVQSFKSSNKDFVFSTEHFYIPESWYIQQLIEGGIIGFLLFVALCVLIFFGLRHHPFIQWSFLGVLVMNIFLHTFESVHSALALFTIIAVFLPVGSRTTLGK